jgi:hypothetical protein
MYLQSAASIQATYQDMVEEEEKRKDRDFFGRPVDEASTSARYYDDMHTDGIVTRYPLSSFMFVFLSMLKYDFFFQSLFSDPSPEECEVDASIRKDPLLYKSYKGLPKLWCVYYILI